MASNRILLGAESVEQSAGLMDESGSEATTTGTEATSVSQQMQEQVDEIGEILLGHFRDLNARLQDAVGRSSQGLSAAEWEGQSHVEAVDLDSDLATGVRRFMENSEAGVTEFKTHLMSRIGAFVAEVEGPFNQMMVRFDESYRSLATGSRQHSADMQDLDASFGRRFA